MLMINKKLFVTEILEMQWFKKLIEKYKTWKAERAYKKRIKELKKQDPFTYD